MPFVKCGHEMEGEVFQKAKKACKTINAAEEAFKLVIDPKSTKRDVEAGIKKTCSDPQRHIDRSSHERAKKTVEKRKKNKVMFEEDESEEEIITCGGGMDDLPKDDEEDEKPEVNSGGVFDYVSSGITA